MTKKPKPSTTADPPFAIPNWPDMNAKPWKLDRIKPYPNNPRSHPEEQIALLADMMKRWGPDQPIVVDEKGVILKGHGRLDAARLAGFEEFPVVQRLGLPETEKRAIRIADNQVALLSAWDADAMRLEITDLRLEQFDIELLGFGEHDLNTILAEPNVGKVDPESTPDTPKKAIVRTGDVWVLGEHRLICGDITKSEDVASVMKNKRADLVFTDPPYNVAYSGLGQNKLGVIENDDMPMAEFGEFLSDAFKNIFRAMKDLAIIYVCHPDAASGPKMSFERAFADNFQKSATIIWVKNAAGMGWQDYRSQHEPILYGWKKGKGKHPFYGDRTKTTVWALSRDAQASYKHPTQKPVSLAVEAINNSSQPGQIVFDPFIGSGTVLIGCEMTARKCVAIELDPRFAEVTIRRWQDFSGKLATLESGETLEEVAKSRSSKAGSAYRRTRDQGFRPASI